MSLFRTLAAVALTGTTLSACSTFQGDGIGEIDRAFLVSVMSWDLNKDGTVTCDEWKAYATAAFKEADASRDGKLTRVEFETVIKGDRLFHYANFDYFDANRDGFVDMREFVERPNPAFSHLDKDKSCRLTPEKIAMTRTLTQAPREVAADPNADKGAKGVGIPK